MISGVGEVIHTSPDYDSQLQYDLNLDEVRDPSNNVNEFFIFYFSNLYLFCHYIFNIITLRLYRTIHFLKLKLKL